MKSKRNGTSTSPAEPPVGTGVEITDTHLIVRLRDGRAICTPLEWYPSLVRATPEERAMWRWWGDGSAIHWPAIDEHLGIEAMLRGNPSYEYTRQRQLANAAA